MSMQMNMDINTCNVNHLDADALLPPRKRLLAGLKRHNSDVNSPAISTPIIAESENYVRLNDPWRPQTTIPNLSNEEIVEASRIAAIKAAKAAEAARANAEEKAAKAAKAVAAAKTALDLVASLSEDREKYLKKNKTKKHVPVEALYNKKKRNTNCRTDEELAHKLHRAINSSPRISKSPSASNMKSSHKHKKLKASRNTVCSEVKVGERNHQPSSTAITSGDRVVGDVAPIKEIDMIMVDLNTPRTDKGGDKPNNGERGQTSKSERLKLESSEVLDISSKKRGRIKQKKLPLSICSFRDRTGPREEPKLLEDNAVRKAVVDQPVFSNGNGLMPPVERTTSMWKCQSFKSPACVKQNKVMQS